MARRAHGELARPDRHRTCRPPPEVARWSIGGRSSPPGVMRPWKPCLAPRMTLHAAAGMVPLVIRAKMAAGVAHAVPWGTSLDGLLASEIRENMKAVSRDAGTDYPPYRIDTVPEDLELPLARCPDGADRWHWAATFAYLEDEVPGPHVQYWSARPDQQALSQMAVELPSQVSERQGRYRSRVMPLPLTVCRTLVWRAVGDPAAVAALLEPIISIGKKCGSGHGHVLSWELIEHPAADSWAFAHLHPDGSLGRTIPAVCLHDGEKVRVGGKGWMGLRRRTCTHPVAHRCYYQRPDLNSEVNLVRPPPRPSPMRNGTGLPSGNRRPTAKGWLSAVCLHSCSHCCEQECKHVG